jgi:hypothetical protein
MPILDYASRSTFNGTGRAVVIMGPNTAVAGWQVERITISTTSALPTLCNVYRNAENPTAMIDNSLSGNGDASDNVSEYFYPGESIMFIWSGGTPGAIATANVRGTLA